MFKGRYIFTFKSENTEKWSESPVIEIWSLLLYWVRTGVLKVWSSFSRAKHRQSCKES